MLICFTLKAYFAQSTHWRYAGTKKPNTEERAITRAPVRLSENDTQVQSAERARFEQVTADKAPGRPSEVIDRAAAKSGKRQKKKKKKKRPSELQLASKTFDQVVVDLKPEMMALNKYVLYAMTLCSLIFVVIV